MKWLHPVRCGLTLSCSLLVVCMLTLDLRRYLPAFSVNVLFTFIISTSYVEWYFAALRIACCFIRFSVFSFMCYFLISVICMNWFPLLFSGYCHYLFWFSNCPWFNQREPTQAVRWAIHALSTSLVLAQDVSGSPMFWTFMHHFPALELLIPPRSWGLFEWRVVLRSQDLCTGDAIAVGVSLLPGPLSG